MAGPLGERGGPVKRSLIWRKDLAESKGSLVMLSSPPEPPARRKTSLYNVPQRRHVMVFSFISVKFGSVLKLSTIIWRWFLLFFSVISLQDICT